MINVNGIKRNAKNIVKKYSDAQVKVREATSNDRWGPSSTIMAEIADLTYNVVAFSEIMQMIWKRLNDHGKNWRHVYKALVVLEYLIKTGTEKVAQQCIENIFAIQTLKDFQYLEENKDYGLNIREKSKKLVSLLKDPEKLKAERARAIKAKARLAESMSSIGKTSHGALTSSSTSSGSGDTTMNNSGVNYSSHHNDSGSSSSANPNELGSSSTNVGSDIDSARPLSLTEEENQLKLALALSKEEADRQEKTRKNDELRLKLALDVSKKTVSTTFFDDLTTLEPPPNASLNQSAHQQINAQPVASSSTAGPIRSTIDDLLGLTISPHEQQDDPWSNDPWETVTSNSTPAPQQPNLTIHTSPETATNVPAHPIASNNVFNRKPMSKNPFED